MKPLCQDCNKEPAKHYCLECEVKVGSKCKCKHPNLVKFAKGRICKYKNGNYIWTKGCGNE